MWNMIYPILIVVMANTFYNICTKSMPKELNSFAGLAITYGVAALLSVIMFFMTSEQKNLLHELTKANWTSFILGFAIVALEFGFICIYRAGWKISVATVIGNIILAVVLIVVGVLIYKESVSVKQVIGVALCAVGLFLMM